MVLFWKSSNLWMYMITGTTFVIFSTISVLTYMLLLHNIPPQYLQVTPSAEHTVKPFATVLMIFSAIKAVSSILSTIGIKKEQPPLIALYIGYGAFMAITIFIMALLLLIWMYWFVALVALLFDALYIFCLVKMYDGYESIVRGKCLGNLEHNLLREEEPSA